MAVAARAATALTDENKTCTNQLIGPAECWCMFRTFRLTQEPGGLGPSCSAKGLAFAGVPLVVRRAGAFTVRSEPEVRHLIGACGIDIDVPRLQEGLAAVARALNEGNLPRALIAAVHLRLPELDWHAAARIAQADEQLKKYDPNEPRDWHGRWTTGGDTTGSASSDSATDLSPWTRPSRRMPKVHCGTSLTRARSTTGCSKISPGISGLAAQPS
jgi:hypothetical protein